MSVDMREPFAQSLWSAYTLSLLAYIAWGVVAFLLLLKRGRKGVLGFAMLFPWLMFMTEFSTIRIQESFVLYRSYLWAVGACVVLPLLLDQLEKRMAIVVVVACSLALFPIAMERLSSLSHPLVMWGDAEKLVKDKPELLGAYRIYYNRGTELIKVDEYDLAIKDLKMATQLHPTWPFSYNNLGSAYAKNGQWKEAAEAFTRAIDIASAKHMGINPKSYFGRALSYESLGKSDLAKLDYQVTCKAVKKGCEKITN